MLVNLTKDEIRTMMKLILISNGNHPDVNSLYEKLQGIYDACTCKEQENK